jgi:REP element-mobilizing transposase RayT
MAYFLTWHTYGTWLHGDQRGSVDDRHNQPETPMIDPNPERKRRAVGYMKAQPLLLDDAGREIVAATIRSHCLLRHWGLYALAVRTNHIHLVVENCSIAPERMIIEFKAWSTRRLRDAGFIRRHQPVWAHHGSTRYLWKAQAVDSAVAYVELGQDMPR